MIDFALDEYGDIAVSKKEQGEKLKIKFNVSEYPVLKINFKSKSKQRSWNKNGLKIRFNTDIYPKTYYSAIETVRDEDEVSQSIAIRLKTELNELQDFFYDFGCELNRIRHNDLLDSKTISLVQEYVEKAISDIIGRSQLSVSVNRIIDSDETNLMSVATLEIKISDNNGQIIYSYRI